MTAKSTREKIATWIKRQYFKHDGAVTRVVLTHRSGAQRNKNVESFSVPSMDADDVDRRIEFLAEEIELAAADHAEAFERVQKYNLEIFISGEEHSPASTGFRISTIDYHGTDEETEPPTQQGQHGQILRHNEALTRHVIGFSMQQFQAADRQIQALSELNERLMKERLNNLTATESLLTQQNERDIANKAAEQRMELMSDVVGQLKLLGPVLMNRAAGRQLLPAANPQSVAIRSLLESIKSEQAESIVDLLDQSQAEMFADLLTRISDSKTANVLPSFAVFAKTLEPQQMQSVMAICSPAQQILMKEIFGMGAPAPQSEQAKH